MKTAPTAASKPVALEFRKSLLACFVDKEQANELVLSSIATKAWEVRPACGKRSRSLAALAAPIHHFCLIHRDQIKVLARQVGDPILSKIALGLSKRGALRPESVAGK